MALNIMRNDYYHLYYENIDKIIYKSTENKCSCRFMESHCTAKELCFTQLK